MKEQAGRGTPESAWYVARRCLAVINRLQQGPANKAELLEQVYRAEDREAPVADLARRFDHDKERLANRLGVKIAYDKGVKGYVIVGWERPLLNLPDHDLTTLAFLLATFQQDAPRSLEVRQLLDRLVSWLPPERQKRFQQAVGQQATADLRLRDGETIAPDVWTAVQEGWQAKQEIQFDYLSPSNESGIPRQHHVQPWDLFITERGHWRLTGYCLFSDTEDGPSHPRQYFHYRLSRIVPGSVEILSRKLPAVRPNGRSFLVIFELSPVIARFGVSQRRELIEPPKLTELDEGWVRVEGKTRDVFDLARNLLYYGRYCRVLGGPELLGDMRQLARELGEMYQ
jgi:predicted DNA-binding transcriptional regulator YafY